MELTRRETLLALVVAAFNATPLRSAKAARPRDLVPDPDRLLDLPAGFSYRVLSRAGEKMNDGLVVPGQHDGMGAFARADGRIVLVRNHENLFDSWEPELTEPVRSAVAGLDSARLYDAGRDGRPLLGGTTTLVFDPARGRLEHHFMSLAGTARNCSGGVTPWGSWISCEEHVNDAGHGYARDHGYAFEVPSSATALVPPSPLRGLGRFNHEAAAVDSASGCVYLTEDRADGLLYRFVPERRGDLTSGRLQALRFRDRAEAETHNRGPAALIPQGERLTVRWVDLTNVDAPGDTLRLRGAKEHRAATFMRAEGIVRTGSGLVLSCTIGGAKGLGQLWRYRPSAFEGRPGEEQAPATLELVYESPDAEALENPDNLIACPWGGLIVCEDSPEGDRLIHVDAAGRVAPFARNPSSPEEFAGACFSADGAWLFVNIQKPGATYAIRGPWKHWASAE